MAGLVAGAGRPVRGLPRPEVVLRALFRIGDRLPEALRGGLDVNLVDLLHRLLQFVLQAREGCCPGLGVLADPAVVDEADRNGVEVVELPATVSNRRDEAGVGEHAKVLHDAEAGHPRECCLQLGEGLSVALTERVEQGSPARICQRPEDLLIHEVTICDRLVTCQCGWSTDLPGTPSVAPFTNCWRQGHGSGRQPGDARARDRGALRQ